MASFLALPKKHMPRAQVNFVVQAGRKFRLFSLTLQKYKKFKALPNYFAKKARKKARSCIFQKQHEKSGHFVIMSLVNNVLEIDRK